ncbi:uncharacterized protein F5Z01DRAFT_647966 [Emericellopsis atlantica]|uniref:Cell wall protein PhiA n=1 Tax=Emericellopsis atlantica TaxID=2614577 RepID=A0A9P7ZT82_9HYPO|nr:uncharacterized protein F5Z01DRAFT_647966 [Emericellopsis atlantica]KAG9257208.1 hypothetical protein F5Z01DRAFT_647966 [Emericellopsis atlantica]
MKFTALTTLFAAGLTSAAPAPTPSATPSTNVKAFNLMTLRSASPIHFGQVSASKSNIFVNLPEDAQDATCDAKVTNGATFSLRDGALFLYNEDTDEEQQVWVDRSGMGQGNVGYISGGQNPPRNAELTGWTSTVNGDFSYLNFNGAGLIACPAVPEGSWSVWVNAGVTNPGGSEGCLGFNAMVQPTEEPVSCTYS